MALVGVDFSLDAGRGIAYAAPGTQPVTQAAKGTSMKCCKELAVSEELLRLLGEESIQFPRWAWALLIPMTAFTCAYAVLKKEVFNQCATWDLHQRGGQGRTNAGGLFWLWPRRGAEVRYLDARRGKSSLPGISRPYRCFWALCGRPRGS